MFRFKTLCLSDDRRNDLRENPGQPSEQQIFCFCLNLQFAKEASKSLRMDHGPLPSAFQIRFAGFKGMVALAPPAAMPSHLKLRMRRSMKKFDSKHHHLEVIEAARFLPGNLNRQIILLLSALGIRDKVFVDLQENMIRHLDAMLKDDHVSNRQS